MRGLGHNPSRDWISPASHDSDGSCTDPSNTLPVDHPGNDGQLAPHDRQSHSNSEDFGIHAFLNIVAYPYVCFAAIAQQV